MILKLGLLSFALRLVGLLTHQADFIHKKVKIHVCVAHVDEEDLFVLKSSCC